jgi:hypothetical protein
MDELASADRRDGGARIRAEGGRLHEEAGIVGCDLYWDRAEALETAGLRE